MTIETKYNKGQVVFTMLDSTIHKCVITGIQYQTLQPLNSEEAKPDSCRYRIHVVVNNNNGWESTWRDEHQLHPSMESLIEYLQRNVSEATHAHLKAAKPPGEILR